MQAKAQPGQYQPLALERSRFVQAQVAQADQRIDIAHAEGAQRHPAERVDVTQTARAVLDVRLQVVSGVAKALMPLQQFIALGQEEFARRPDQAWRHSARQPMLRGGIGAQRARFDQCGQHRLVGSSLGALRR
ncbi:hypothetical protein D3C81_969040 [compost metagenome]